MLPSKGPAGSVDELRKTLGSSVLPATLLRCEMDASTHPPTLIVQIITDDNPADPATLAAIRLAARSVLIETRSAGLHPDRLKLLVTAPVTDRYGVRRIEPVVTAEYRRVTLDKIDPAGFQAGAVFPIADRIRWGAAADDRGRG